MQQSEGNEAVAAMWDRKLISLRRADRQALLMARMMETLDVSSGSGETGQRELDAAYGRCVRCAESSLCQAWLDGEASDAAYRAFCPNATLFGRLKVSL